MARRASTPIWRTTPRFVRGLIALYESTFDLRWLGEATRLVQIMFDQFHDSANGGFFQTGVDHEELVARRKDFVDNAIPSGNSLAAETLLRLAVFLGEDRYRREAGRILLMMKDAMARQPTGFGRLLSVLDAYLAPSQEVAIVGAADDPGTGALLAEVRGRFLPHTVLASNATRGRQHAAATGRSRPGGRQTGRLRLRELRVQAARDRAGGVGGATGYGVE